MRTHILHIQGLHCPSCIVLNEEALREVSGVTHVKVDLAKQTVVVSGELPESIEDTIALLSPKMPQGYTLSTQSATNNPAWNEFIYAIPIAALLIIGFILLQKTGLVSITAGSEAGLGTSLIIGLVASVSTCLAVVGGLVLSVSASYAHTGNTWRPQASFHIGRLIGFFLLGGALGYLGKSMELGRVGSLVLAIIVALIMLILGFNLLDLTHHAKKFQLHMPGILGRAVRSLKNSSNPRVPLLLGVATFFLPCGFTQSMQAYALTTGGFISGGLTMLVFALGTLPMLVLLSFSAFSINNKSWRGVFFKTAGILVIVLAVINLLGALAVAGIIEPVF